MANFWLRDRLMRRLGFGRLILCKLGVHSILDGKGTNSKSTANYNLGMIEFPNHSLMFYYRPPMKRGPIEYITTNLRSDMIPSPIYNNQKAYRRPTHLIREEHIPSKEQCHTSQPADFSTPQKLPLMYKPFRQSTQGRRRETKAP